MYVGFALTIWEIQYIAPFKDLVLKVNILPGSVGQWIINNIHKERVAHH
jgi:hypothetical protein